MGSYCYTTGSYDYQTGSSQKSMVGDVTVPGLSTGHTSPCTALRAERRAGSAKFRAKEKSGLLLFQRPPLAVLFCLSLFRHSRIRARSRLSTRSSSLQQHGSAATEGLLRFSCKAQHRESMALSPLAMPLGTPGDTRACLGCPGQGLQEEGLCPAQPGVPEPDSLPGPETPPLPQGLGQSAAQEARDPWDLPSFSPPWGL